MKVLVLNMDYNPINITSLKNGFRLVFKGKAEIVSYDKNSFIITTYERYLKPTVIRLLKYVVVPYRKIQLNRQNIFKRDGNKCVYCRSNKDLTIDHVIPKSKGGKNTWENLVTCCQTCNIRKGDHSLNTIDMKLSHKPFKPTFLYFVEKIHKINEDWKVFVGVKN